MPYVRKLTLVISVFLLEISFWNLYSHWSYPNYLWNLGNLEPRSQVPLGMGLWVYQLESKDVIQYKAIWDSKLLNMKQELPA